MKKLQKKFIIILLISLFCFIGKVYAYDYSKSCTKEAAIELAKIVYHETGAAYSNDENSAFLLQSSTAAVVINNANRTAKSTKANSDNWQEKIYYLINDCYNNHSGYRDKSIDEKIPKNLQGKFLYIAELVLSGKYTFPTNMTIQGAPDAPDYVRQYATTNDGWHIFTNTGGYDTMIAYEEGLNNTGKDQFGNKLTNTSFSYYSNLAKSYQLSDYSKYTPNTVCTGITIDNQVPTPTPSPTPDKEENSTIVDACTNPDILRVIYFAKLILDIVKIIIPVGLIIMGMIDFSKSVVTSDEGSQKKNVKLFVKRIIFAVLVFAVPWIVETLIVSLGNLTDGVNFTDCLENAESDCIEQIENGTFIGKCYGKKDYACYYCPSSNSYLWRPGSPSENCPGGVGWSKKENIEESKCKNGACYYCPSSNSYLWNSGTPSENCPGGIGWSKQTGKNIENCK